MALPKVNQGDLITAKGWNDMVDEFEKKVNKAGDTMTGPLVIGAALQTRSINIVDQNNAVFPDNSINMANNIDGATKWLHIGGITDAGARRIALFADRTFVSGNLGIKNTNPSADLDVNGTAGVNNLRLNGSGNSMNIAKSNTEMRLSLGFSGFFFPGQPPFSYRFRVGHDALVVIGQEPFVQRFSVNQNGDITASGSKAGYVADFFINNIGEPLEEGDVVVIGDQGINRYYGTYNNIPIPEVDLTDKAYDTRVCGIVAKVVAENDLPPVDPPQVTPEEVARAEAADKGKKKSKHADPAAAHPFHGMGAAMTKDFNHRVVKPNQIGQMVTLGAFAHCKVDANIAAIEPGDLLTTSPTKGHAQKVTDIKKATGAIIGKALSGLKKGKGKIPVMVFFN